MQTSGVYTVSGPKGQPFIGSALEAKKNPLAFLMRNAIQYGDIIPCDMAGKKLIQLNHPDLIRHVLIDNHKNYHKSASYLRYEPALGQSLFTSNGDKWKRDRQRVQPMFRREKIEGYYFTVVNEVSEKFKQRWLKLTESGPVRLCIADEMADLTMEIILKLIFGKDNFDPASIASLHYSFNMAMEYSKTMRLVPKLDMRKLFGMPSSRAFYKELQNVEAFLQCIWERHRRGEMQDAGDLFGLLVEAHNQNPEQFTARDVRDHAIGMIFGGYETTSILMQWMWYALDYRPDIERQVRDDIISHAPCAAQPDSSAITFEQVSAMDYLTMVLKETMRLYPPLWAVARTPVASDTIGGLAIAPGDEILLPQIAMHRHPRWWPEPNAFIPERFSTENEAGIDLGLYFPFTHGLRKCIGYKLAEMEANILTSKFVPLFRVKMLNVVANTFSPAISLKMKERLVAEISRA